MIDKQIKETFYKAFFDMINDTVNSKKPDFDWIVSLYIEIKQRLLKLVPKDKRTYKLIDESFDTELFSQMIRNDVFDGNSMVKLIQNTFYWIQQLQAPVQDKYTNDVYLKVLNTSPDKIVATFIQEVNICIDMIEKDLQTFYETTKS